MKKIALALLAAMMVFSCGEQSSPELFCVCKIQKHDEMWGYINTKGMVVIPLRYYMAYPFSYGLALVQDWDDDLMGFINEKGEPVERLQGFISATPFSEGMATVVRPLEAPVVVNTSGEELFSIPEADKVSMFSEGMCLFSVVTENGDRYGFVNKKGEVVIPATLGGAGPFKEGLAPARKAEDNSKWGFIDKAGKWVIDPVYDAVDCFSEGLAMVYSGDSDLYGYINRQGKLALPFQFKISGPFQEGLACAGTIDSPGEYGYINKKGQFVIPPRFRLEEDDQVEWVLRWGRSFSNGLALTALSDDFYGYVDRKGQTVISGLIGAPFMGPVTPAARAVGEKMGLINKSGEFIVVPEYDWVLLWDSYGSVWGDAYADLEYEAKSNYVDMSWLETGGVWANNPWGYSDGGALEFDMESKSFQYSYYDPETEEMVEKEGRFYYVSRTEMMLECESGEEIPLTMDVKDQRLKMDGDWLYGDKGTAYNEKMRREYNLESGTVCCKNLNVWCVARGSYRTATSITFYEFPEGSYEKYGGAIPFKEALRTETFSVRNGRDLRSASGNTIGSLTSHWPYDGFDVPGDEWYSGDYGSGETQ